MGLRKVIRVIGDTFRTVVQCFCENSTLHGLRYVYGGDRMLRMLWQLVCLISIGFTMIMGMIAWMRFRTTPTITTIETMTYPIWNIPFPAVTVCNINKIDKRKASVIIDQIVKEFGMSEENATGLLVAQASLVNFEAVNTTYLELERVLGLMGWNPDKLLLELNQPCDELIKVCYWLGSEVPCPHVIHRTRTDYGFCCSYNVDETMHPLIAKRNQTDHQAPYRAKRLSGAGRHVGLSILIDVEPDTYMAPTKSYYGAEIYVHDSSDFPSDADFEHVAQPGWDVVMSVIPLPIESSSTMSQVPEAMRNCYLPEESNAQPQDNFNLNVCMAKCRLRTILKLCNCNYNVQTIASQRQSKSFMSTNFGGRNVSMYATLNIHFKDIYCVKYKRDAYMTWDSLVATFGGIFGLCMGGSVLSIVELLYYFTVKPFTVYQERAKNPPSSGKQEGSGTRKVLVRPYVARYDNISQYPVGYFSRRNVLARERSTAKRLAKQVPQPNVISFIY
uniref:Sodium channel protein Nach n=1 Tax=Anopheles farauti TaxID=69004 RepID=A0A182QFM1_9DIPT